MSPFEYRLEKVLKYRMNKKEEQVQRVIDAQNKVNKIQAEIDTTNGTITSLRQNMFSAAPTLFDNFDKYIKHLFGEIEKLEIKKQSAINKLLEEQKILEELERSIKALEKHKEKAYELYSEEEKEREMKILNEIGSQKHFARQVIEKEEAELEELALNDEEIE